MHAHRFTWWLRPVRKVDRVGEQSAVVCHCEYRRPLSASFWSVGMLMRPPNGDHAASPVSSYRTIKTFGAPFGAVGSAYGVQSGFESRTSSLMTPLKGLAMTQILAEKAKRRDRAHVDAPWSRQRKSWHHERLT